MDDVFGQDVQLGDDEKALVAANGELLLTDGSATGVQDIRLRLFTPLHELFYDDDFGSLIHEWYLEENTIGNRNGFEAEVEQRIDADPRVVLGTVACKVVRWDETGFVCTAQWEFITETHPFNLVIAYDSTNKELVIKDVNPRSGL